MTDQDHWLPFPPALRLPNGRGRHPMNADKPLTDAERLAKVEAQIDTLTRALHLTTVAAKPASEWLDAQMAKIDANHGGA